MVRTVTGVMSGLVAEQGMGRKAVSLGSPNLLGVDAGMVRRLEGVCAFCSTSLCLRVGLEVGSWSNALPESTSRTRLYSLYFDAGTLSVSVANAQ